MKQSATIIIIRPAFILNVDKILSIDFYSRNRRCFQTLYSIINAAHKLIMRTFRRTTFNHIIITFELPT